MGTPDKTPPAPKPPAPPRPESTPDVDENSDESFPASDPPGWSPSRAEPDKVKPPVPAKRGHV